MNYLYLYLKKGIQIGIVKKCLFLIIAVSFSSLLFAQAAISVHPSTGTQTVCVGGTAVALSVTATGTGLTYQWFSNTSNSNSGGSLIDLATSNTYTPPTSLTGVKYYYVIVYSTDLSTATSNASGAITVNALPVSSYVASPSVLCSGFPVQFNGPSACGSNAAINFSGSNSAALHFTLTTQIDNITMEVWAKWNGGKNSQSDDQMIFYNGHTGNGGYGILMTANGNLKILIGGLAYLGSSQNLIPGVWTHIAIVRNAGTWSLYLNGTQYAVSPNNTSPRDPTVAGGNQTSVGADQSGTGHLFYGSIDEVKFWTVARSSANIQTDMTDCSVNAQSGLLAYWSFNDGSGSTAVDGSGNGYSLNLSGTNWLIAGAPTGATYAWDFGESSTSALAADAHTYATSGIKNTALTVTDLISGCTSNSSSSISINLSPTANISGTATACNLVTLTASGGSTYSWSGGNSTATAINTFNSSNNYTVIVTDAIGCTATATQSVTINALPTSAINGPVPTLSTFVNSGLNRPYALAMDGTGNLYVTNYNGNSIEKVDAIGSVSSFVSSGLNRPAGLAFDGSGNLYVSNYNGNSIVKVDASGTVTSFVNSGLNRPFGLAFDGSGNLYVANYGANSISKVDASGTVTSFVSSGLSSPSGLAFDGSGNLYVANSGSNIINKVDASGTVTSFVSSGLSNPSGLAFDGSGNFYVANYGGNSISKVDASGTVSSFVSSGLSNPRGLQYEATNKLLYVTNSSNNSVTKVTFPTPYITSICYSGAVTLIASPGTNETIDWFADASGGSALLAGSTNYTTPTISVTTTYYAESRNTTTGCISATRTALIATVNDCHNTWNGTTNTDWNTGSNWSQSAMPISTDDVIIPVTANQPIINTAGASAKTVIINNAAILTLTSPGTLTVTNGITVNPGGYLVGNSSNVTGTVTLQQSIIGQRGYRLFSNPFSTTQTDVSGSGLNATVTTANDVKTWSNAGNAWVSDGAGYNSVSIGANTPYALFVRGASTDNVTGLNYSTGPSVFTYSVSGTLNGNSVGVTPTSSSNFMVVGNPYAAPVYTAALTGGGSTPYYTYQITTQAGSTGGTPNTHLKAGIWVPMGNSTNDPTTNTIPVLGVVAYQPASTSTFYITPSHIITNGTPQDNLFGIEPATNQLELLVQQNGNYQDKLFVKLDASSTATGADKTDLQKFYNDNVNVYTLTTDNTRLAIDARNVLSTIPLGISALIGDYNFRVNSNSLSSGTTVYLQDNLLHTQTALETGSTYNFSITTDAATQGEQRFALVFANKTAVTAITDSSNAKFTAKVLGNVVHGNTVTIEIAGSTSPINIVARDINGKILSTATGVNGTNTVQLGNAASGICIVQISNASSTITEKIIKL